MPLLTSDIPGLDEQLAIIKAELAELKQAQQKPHMKKQLYSTKEAATALNVSTRQISRYEKLGKIKRTGVDGKNQFTAASIEALQAMAK